MSIYLLLAGCSSLMAPLNKGSRDFLRIRNLSSLAAASSAYMTVDTELHPAAPFWRDYDLARKTANDGWRDYHSSAESHHIPESGHFSYSFPMHRTVRMLQVDHHLLAATAGPSTSASPLSDLSHRLYRQRMALSDALIQRQSKGYNVEGVNEDIYLP
ncbi:hypothetical protein B0H17DRAFT_1180480, partial [Mycena rosella]